MRKPFWILGLMLAISSLIAGHAEARTSVNEAYLQPCPPNATGYWYEGTWEDNCSTWDRSVNPVMVAGKVSPNGTITEYYTYAAQRRDSQNTYNGEVTFFTGETILFLGGTGYYYGGEGLGSASLNTITLMARTAGVARGRAIVNPTGKDVENAGLGGPTGSTSGTTLSACSDGRDNDYDGLIDILDPGCHSDGNANNPNSYVWWNNSESYCCTVSLPPSSSPPPSQPNYCNYPAGYTPPNDGVRRETGKGNCTIRFGVGYNITGYRARYDDGVDRNQCTDPYTQVGGLLTDGFVGPPYPGEAANLPRCR